MKPSSKLNLYVLLVLILIALSIFFYMVRIFIIPFVTSLVFATLIYPLFRRFAKLFPKRRGIASLLFCLLIVIVLFVPLYFLGRLVFDQARSFTGRVETELEEFIGDGEGIWDRITQSGIVQWLESQGLQWKSWIETALDGLGSFISTAVDRTSSRIFRTLLGTFVFLFSQFYLLRDSDRIKKGIRALSPLKKNYEEKIIDKFKLIARATNLGTVVIGLIQGTIGSVTFLLWGIIMGPVILALLLTLLEIYRLEFKTK